MRFSCSPVGGLGPPKRAREIACGAKRRVAPVAMSGKPGRDLLQKPAIAVGIAERGAREIAAMLGIRTARTGPPKPRWKISLTLMPAATSASRATSMSETTRKLLAEPGAADVRVVPNCTEHPEPCGVN